MAVTSNKGEANPNKNTGSEVNLNPIVFDELALSKMLESKLFNTEPVEEKLPAAADAEEQEVAEDQPPEETVEIQDESPESVLSEDKEEEAEEPVDSEESIGVQKRIDKLTRAKKEATEKLSTLEQELNETKSKLQKLEEQPPYVEQHANNPFSEVWDMQKLQAEYQKARELKRWCEDNADGAELNGKDYTYEDIKSIRRKVEDAIDMQIPQRAQFIQEHNQIRPTVEKLYPFWKDRASVEYTEAQHVLRQLPTIANMPDYQILVGDFIMGRKMRMEAAKKSGIKTAQIKVAPKQPSAPSASQGRVDKDKATAEFSRKRFLNSGGVDELAHLLKGM